ncbi:MAG: prolyl oligopeptidase family serine peptidase, partial [Ignavibacteria bacterium]|nr:prolyl oligopeptidase family serine peptidase [Ignavibacteria bacterium]
IIDRKRIDLGEIQLKMIASGWGNDCVENSVVEKITYLSDDLKVNGYLAYPKDTSKKYPCVIWCRGGYGNAGAIDEFNARGIFGQIASWGYVVFSSQYRGSAGSEGKDEFGGADLNDIINIIPAAEELEFAETELWGIEGWSRGGMMTYLTLTRSNIFKCAIISGGIANLGCNANESSFMHHLYERVVGRNEEQIKKLCNERSIVNFPEKLSPTTPILILHGNNDTRVLPHDSLDLAAKLLDLKFAFRLILFEGGDHFLKGHRKVVDQYRKEWFTKFLPS